MSISVKNYTNRFVVVVILIVIAVWAALFYAILMDEVYDNIDDGLKNQKIEIIREAYRNPDILDNSKEFGINQFVIRSVADAAENIDQNVFSREFIYMPYDEEEEPYRVLRTGFYAKDGKPYELELRTSTVEEDDFLINLAVSLAVLYIVIVISIFLINHVVFARAWRPFYKILSNLDHYRFGNTKSFISIETEVKEFQQMNNHITRMIERNESVFAEQKLFLENASHELQTPLAVSINKLSLLLEDENLTEKQMIKVSEAKISLHRMVALNKSLLMLSRIDNKQFAEVAEVELNTIIKNSIADFQEILDFKELKLELIEHAKFEITINPNLAQILISNLLNNAIKYNKEAGKIQVEIQTDKISIANTSTTGALNPSYIFRRFYKGAEDHNSNGLGLSIVQSILDTCDVLSLHYDYRGGKHFFELKM